jgi:hypothetical protein
MKLKTSEKLTHYAIRSQLIYQRLSRRVGQFLLTLY